MNRLILIIFGVSTAIVLALGTLAILPTNQQTTKSSQSLPEVKQPQPNQASEKILPTSPKMVKTPDIVDALPDTRVLVEDAKYWADASGFRLALPRSLPAGYVPIGAFVNSYFNYSNPGAKLLANNIILVFVPEGISGEDNKPSKIYEAGGLFLDLERTKSLEHGFCADIARKEPNAKLAEEIRINGKSGIHYSRWPCDPVSKIRILVWNDGDTQFRLSASNLRFSLEDLLNIADSIG